ncbi:putative ADP-ribosylation factor GTPase-activating protein AGD14 isoform X2 [Carex littledalei]|uniref:Putative ADP-ribosylation factor GTPase-activating protein AGD14 isoform X2 n=1 Tax=Carex littledalei TaxID=544730 RepID=A0A833V880_9POAL|nr:putative ADP-ribosylation factor GTPase-activating protein AGD14 isoform X2 [Carex littledalei]
MGSRMKEDEKNEKIIRGLSKLSANRRCINCNSQGTQYVCTNFATFICINCSGIHREFTHRVKSISMATFTTQEITALQEGGNEIDCLKLVQFDNLLAVDCMLYYSRLSHDIDKLRDFIKHIYVDQRFVGERNADKPPVVKVERESSVQERSLGPPYDSKQSPRKDKAAASVNRTSSNISDTHKEAAGSTSRAVKEDPPVAVPPLRILEPPKLDPPGTPKTPTPVAPVQSTKTESNTKDTSTQNPPEVKLVSSISLIDFDSDPEPVPKRETPPTSNQNRDVGWASFDTQRPSFAAAPSSSANNLETSLVHQPASRPVPGTTYSQMSIQNNTPHQNNVSLFPTVQRSNPQLNGLPSVGPNIQPWGQTVAPNIHTTIIMPSHASLSRPQQFMDGPGALPMGVTPLQTTTSPAAPSGGRSALPEDLFSMVYAQPPAQMPGWHPAARIQMGYTMQFHTPSPAQIFAQPTQSTNPFDIGNGPKLAHASTFPSMSSMQGALPSSGTGNPNAYSRPNNMDSFGTQWAPQPYQPSYPVASHPSQYSAQPHTNNMVQKVPSNAYYPGNQVPGGYGTVNGGYGLSGMNPQQLTFRNPQPGNSGMYPSVGGNPFA